jgi:GT2 family glycosyltransferase
VISFILPTYDRPGPLDATLAALGSLQGLPADTEVIVVDNASRPAVRTPVRLANDLPVHVVRMTHNAAAAGRNAGALAAAGSWLVMLDDDSAPTDSGFVETLADASPDIAAIGADIRLPDGSREAGGLPEVIVGCGAAIRRDAFLAAGAYDPGFGFYAEEYDLCAKLLLGGWRVVHDRRFRVLHRKVVDGRDRDLIFRNLVRNNGWVMQRYAPPDRRHDEIAAIIERYGAISTLEGTSRGFAAGVRELLETIDLQPPRPMDETLFERFTGLAHARDGLSEEPRLSRGTRAAIVAAGKHVELVRRVLKELGVEIVAEPEAEVLVVGTLSPGPMLDAAEADVVCPWSPRHAAAVATSE